MENKINKERKIEQMREFICQYGTITTEYERPVDEYYKNGSYFAHFDSEKLDLSYSIGNIDKYSVYKNIVKEIKFHEKLKEEK